MLKPTMAAAILTTVVFAASAPMLAAGDPPAATDQVVSNLVIAADDEAQAAAKPTTPTGDAKKADAQAKPADKPATGQPKPAEKPPEKPAAPKVAPNALSKNTYGSGFRIGSEDGRFSMRIMAGLQYRYTYMKYDRAVNGNTEDYSNFFIRRGRLWWDGHAYDSKFTYYFHLQLEPMSAVNLHDAWLNYAIKPMFQIGAGRNKIPYGLEFLNSGLGNNMVDRSVMAGETDIPAGGGYSRYPGGGTENFPVSAQDANTGFPVGGMLLFRSQGVSISGRSNDKQNTFEYQVGIWQGRNTKGASNDGTDHLYVARVGFHPMGYINWLGVGDWENTPKLKMAFWASAYTDSSKKKVNYAGTSVTPYKAADSGMNLAAAVRFKGFSTDAEWAKEQYELKDATLSSDKELDRMGWRVQVGQFIKPKKFEVVARVSAINRLKDPTYFSTRNSGLGFAKIKNSSGVFQDAAENAINEMTVGANWYFSNVARQHVFFVDYSRLTRSFEGWVSGTTLTGSVPDQKDDRVRAMLQMKF